MLKIHIITVGTLKEKYLREAVAEYSKRLGRFASLKVTELSEAYLPQTPAAAEVDKALDKEAEAIIKQLSGNVRIALCVEGKHYSSEGFAALVEGATMQGSMDLVIGSSHGLGEKVKRACSHRLSFSEMTFPHQLMRVMLLEQLYRAFKINHNESYHK
ncbi:MAG: 23S rRNA (pseudouridine(1915)-N(3))-methyltransferase RlmH [Clostridia bacterium]|nr:23S rRNA (pseudouridine(1915)-N(3))-methyltransferase RlmH [Clostridia bacterium]